MALDSKLLKLTTSSGVKQLTEVIENIPQAQPPQGARLLIINSRKGIVNKPILVSDWQHYLSLFDGISDAEERRGNFSASSAEFMLQVSPIWVLNLRKFDDEKDLSDYQSFSTSLNINNGDAKSIAYSKLYSKNQFWNIDDRRILDKDNKDNLLVFANVGNKDISIFVRKTRTNQKDITLESYYANLNKELPSYVNPSDKISDWMVDVYIFENIFNVNSRFNTKYGFCFDNDGNVKNTLVSQTGNGTIDGITQLTRIKESGYLRTISGSLIQGFADFNGNNLDIVDLVNNLYPYTNLLCTRNDEMFDNDGTWYTTDAPNSNGMKKPFSVDFKGHSFGNINEVGSVETTNFNNKLVEALSYNYTTKFEKLPNYVFDDTKFLSTSTNIELDNKYKSADISSLFANLALSKVSDTEYTFKSFNNLIVFGDVLKPTLSDSYISFDGNLSAVKTVRLLGKTRKIEDFNTNRLAIQPSKEVDGFKDGEKFTYVNGGKEFPKDANGNYYVYPKNHAFEGLPLLFKTKKDGLLLDVVHTPITTENYFMEEKSPLTWNEYKDIIDAIVDYEVTTSYTLTNVDFTEASLDEILVKYGKDFNVYNVEFDKDLAINTDDTATPFDKNQVITSPNTIVFDNGETLTYYNDEARVFRVKNADDSTKAFKPMNLKAYKLRNEQMLNGTKERQKEILDVLLTKNMKNSLSNKDLIKFNYILDGFVTYIEPNVKYQTKEIAESRILARSIYSMPSMDSFENSTNPYFSQTIDSEFEVKYIPLGGNLELPNSNSFSLPNSNGWYAYGFGDSFVRTTSKLLMPTAPIISNLFQKKYIDGKPFKALAGDNGIVNFNGISGVKYVFNEANDGTGDRDYLEPFGFNVIVNKSNGVQIYSNKTSDNIVTTPMSAIHTSEVVMYIQERINNLLERFVFKAPTRQNMITIKEQADQICEEPRGEGAIYAYRNVMDTSNNTREVIANRIGILDTILYDQNMMEILVHRTTIDSITNVATFEVFTNN